MGPTFWSHVAKLTLFKVFTWAPDSVSDPGDRGEVAGLEDAHVISSLVKDSVMTGESGPLDELFGFGQTAPGGKHHVALDIDHPAWLIESSTPGHYHLHIRLPDGAIWEDYVAFLDAAAKIGMIEPGYAEASKARGATYVRLPWVRKGDTGTLANPTPKSEIPSGPLPF